MEGEYVNKSLLTRVSFIVISLTFVSSAAASKSKCANHFDSPMSALEAPNPELVNIDDISEFAASAKKFCKKKCRKKKNKKKCRKRCIKRQDPDGDNVRTRDDNCPDEANPDQADSDGDGVGDACDQDSGETSPVACFDLEPTGPYVPAGLNNEPLFDMNPCQITIISDYLAQTFANGDLAISATFGFSTWFFPIGSTTATSTNTQGGIKLVNNADNCTCSLKDCRTTEVPVGNINDLFCMPANQPCIHPAFDLDCTCAAGSTFLSCRQKFVSRVALAK